MPLRWGGILFALEHPSEKLKMVRVEALSQRDLVRRKETFHQRNPQWQNFHLEVNEITGFFSRGVNGLVDGVDRAELVKVDAPLGISLVRDFLSHNADLLGLTKETVATLHIIPVAHHSALSDVPIPRPGRFEIRPVRIRERGRHGMELNYELYAAFEIYDGGVHSFTFMRQSPIPEAVAKLDREPRLPIKEGQVHELWAKLIGKELFGGRNQDVSLGKIEAADISLSGSSPMVVLTYPPGDEEEPWDLIPFVASDTRAIANNNARYLEVLRRQRVHSPVHVRLVWRVTVAMKKTQGGSETFQFRFDADSGQLIDGWSMTPLK